jgi:hypothetical protein
MQEILCISSAVTRMPPGACHRPTARAAIFSYRGIVEKIIEYDDDNGEHHVEEMLITERVRHP